MSEINDLKSSLKGENKPEDVAAYMFQMFIPRFRSLVDSISKKKLITFLETFVKITSLEEINLPDELKKQIVEVSVNCYPELIKSIKHGSLGTKALKKLTKLIIEFPLHDKEYKLNNKFEETCFILANNLLQAKFTIFLNNMEKFEELQNSLNRLLKEEEKELLLLSNNLMYAKFMMILHTINEKEQKTETQGETENG